MYDYFSSWRFYLYEDGSYPARQDKVDTFFDLSLTRRLLQGFEPATSAAPIRSLVNTHVHADHVFGNQVVVEEAHTYIQAHSITS